MKAKSDIQIKYTCAHDQFDTCCHVTVLLKFVSHYDPVRHLTTDRHQVLVAAEFPVVDWRGVDSNPAGDI